MRFRRIEALAAALVLSAFAAGCGDDESSTPAQTDAPVATEAPVETDAPVATEAPVETDAPVATEAPVETDAPPATEAPAATLLDAPLVTGFTVDGDAAEWADVPSLELTLDPIGGETVEPRNAVVKVAHDGENVYVLFQVEDDYNWTVGGDAHLTSAVGVAWAIDPSAGEAMGATDEDEETSLGMVDIWHWELECAADAVAGGATSGPGDGKDPGNDEACNFDDEWSTNPETREDDNADGAENSLSGSWSHSDPTADAAGTWTFEMSRPLDTGDSTDAAFAAGVTGQLGVAYWDADATAAGWEDNGHVQSSGYGWIQVTFAS